MIILSPKYTLNINLNNQQINSINAIFTNTYLLFKYRLASFKKSPLRRCNRWQKLRKQNTAVPESAFLVHQVLLSKTLNIVPFL